MSSSLRNARAANRRQRARDQDEDSSGSDVEKTQRSQAKRKKGKQRARDDDDEDDDDDEPASTQRRGATQTQSGTQGLTADSIGSAAFNKKVHDLVKLALYHEYRKQPLRKDDINKKVMDKANTKVFTALFDAAQSILRSRFGLELVGLRPRPEADGGADGGAIDLDGNGEAAPTQGGGKGKKKSTPAAKGYILRSTLPDALLPLLSEPRPISREGSDARVNLAAPTGGDGDGVDCGALIDWQKGDGGPTGGIAMVGLLWVVLGTILVHDRVMTEERLKTIFKDKLDIGDNTLLPPLSRDSIKRQITFDEFLSSLLKQNYLEKVKLTTVNQGEEQHELRWGQRADAEFGEKAVAEFMVDIMATRAPIEPESEEDEPRQTRGKGRRNGQQQNQPRERETLEQRRAKMLADIKQAAGSDLLAPTKV
ncbi:CCAAT- binding transcription factor component [Naganishia albida]|nr:CCAAT- binding transcription factor component [Naganishia albida]